MADHGGREFEASVLPYLDDAFNLARWLMRDRADAEDVVQEAMLRALTYFPGFRGVNPRGWLLQIVRNAAYASMRLNRGAALPAGAGDDPDSADPADPGDDPEAALMRAQDRRGLEAHLAALPVELREVIVLRELEDMPYKEIARITDVPVGTVMSRLWRARRVLAAAVKRAEARP